MTTTINANTSAGLVYSADTSGIVKLQSNGVATNALAWVNFGYVSSAITVRASYNVSSVTRSGTGLYTVNVTNAFTDANYTPQVTASRYVATTSYACNGYAKPTSTSAIFVYTGYEDSYTGQIATDAEYVFVSVFGN